MVTRVGSAAHVANEPRHVLVTGGSSGIGAAVVSAFLSRGDRVTVLDRRRSEDSRVISRVGDVRSPRDLQGAVDAARRDGGLDVLVANAGVHDGGLNSLHLDDEDMIARLRQVMDINVLGCLLAIRAAAPQLTKACGSVVITLSDASFDVRGNNAGVLYATSKHAALGLLRVMARDLAPHVRVNGVAPGGIATGLVRVDEGGRALPVFTDPERLSRSLEQRTLLGRGADLQSLAEAYVFLATESGAAITGQVLRVDGGLIS